MRESQLACDTVLQGQYRIRECIGRLRHGEYEHSSFVYRAECPDGRFCTVYEYFPDDWNCAAKRCANQEIRWDMDMIRERITQYSGASSNVSPTAFLEETFRRFSANAQMCRSFHGQISETCNLNCDVFREHGTCCVVLPETRMQSLYDLIQSRGTLSTASEAERLLRDCLEGLSTLHAQGITHGGITPFNVGFAKGISVLTEFGKPKARQFSSLADWDGPVSEGALWLDADSPEWYNRLDSEQDADTVAIARTIRFCLTGEWNESAWDGWFR